jgi:hypothetical protein
MFQIALLALAPVLLGAAPYRPTDDALVLADVSTVAPLATEQLRALGDDPAVAIDFAERMLAQAEDTQDSIYAQYALRALTPHRDAASPDLRLLTATTLQRLHRFDEALSELDALIASGEAPAQAYFVRSVLRTLRADYRGALADCSALLTRTGALAVAACAALPRARSGGGESAYRALLDMLSATDDDDAIRHYASGVAAELAWRLGKPDALQRLREMADSGKMLYRLAYADALLDSGDAAAAMVALADAPGEGASLRRARALRRLGNDAHQLAQETALLAAAVEARALRDDVSHAREDAYFFLHVRRDAAAALRAAQRNFEQQKEPLDAELLLDAALLAKAPEAADAVRDWARSHRIDDRRLAARGLP